MWLLVFWLSAGSVLAQSGSVCPDSLVGLIQGQDNRGRGTTLPLPGATVFLRELGQGTAAASDGHFRLSHLCPGLYTADFQFIGYKSLVRLLRLPDSTQLVITLTSETVNLQEVQVTEHRSEAQQLLQVQSELSGADLNATRGQSLGESLKTITGLYSIQTGPSISKPVIYGLYRNRIITLNNGHPAGRSAVGNRTRPAN